MQPSSQLLSFWITGLCLACLTVVISTSSHAKTLPGYRTTTITQHADRPLETALWYPTPVEINDTSPTKVAENAAFWGVDVLINAPVSAKPRPLIVISHGYMGNYRNQAWLAAPLAAKGYIVAAVNHPGTTTRNQDRHAAQAIGRRPQDLSTLIDTLMRSPQLAGQIDPKRIYAIGHSLGAWTVMAAAGAQFDHQQFTADCQQHPALAACEIEVYDDLQPRDDAVAWHSLEKDFHDPRLKGIVTLDIGLARGFTTSSLSTITTPIMVIAAGQPSRRIPHQLESDYLADNLVSEHLTYVRIDNARHFSFISACKPGAVALLEAESPGDGYICQDATGVDRRNIHQTTIAHIDHFLEHISQ